MITVLQFADTLTISEAVAHGAGLQSGARVEVTATLQGLLVRRSPLTHEERIALADRLEGEGLRLLPNAGDKVAALLRDCAEGGDPISSGRDDSSRTRRGRVAA